MTVPALDRDHDQIHLDYRRVRRVEWTDPETGLVTVRARDGRPALLGTGLGAALLGGSLALMGLRDEAAGRRYAKGYDARVASQIGLTALGAGIVLLVLGATSDGPEADAPSPGMPASFYEP